MKKLNSILILLIYNLSSYAQCAMCKAGAEQSLEKGSLDANWINYGILLLMFIPFLLMYALYRLYKYNQNAV
jgi:hypothetical protein